MLSALIWQFHNINLAIPVIHFGKLRNFFRRAAVAICSCKGDFKNSSFLQKTTFNLTLIFFRGTKRSFFKYQIFVRTMYFFLNTTSSHPTFKAVCHFIWREQLRPSILPNVLVFFVRLDRANYFFMLDVYFFTEQLPSSILLRLLYLLQKFRKKR